MRDAIVVAVQKHRSEGNHVFGIIVRNSMQVAKFALAGLFISHDEGHLNVAAVTAGRIANKVYLAGLKHSDGYVIAFAHKVLVYDVFDNLLNVALARAAYNSIA